MAPFQDHAAAKFVGLGLRRLPLKTRTNRRGKQASRRFRERSPTRHAAIVNGPTAAQLTEPEF
jgi:hypothetical protein